jgi:glycosyltransferase involved in cell wall biosynthesis
MVDQTSSAESRLRVLFIIGSMGGGGAERQILEIIKRIDRNRFQPVLYLAVKEGELLDEVPAEVPIFAYWDGSRETWLLRILRWMKLTRLLRQLYLAQVLHRQRIDLIYDRTYLATLDAAGGCTFRPTRRISCCVADPGPELELHARWSIRASKWFARRAYKSASIVLANSEGLRQRVLEYFKLSPQQVQVFYNLLSEVRNVETKTSLDAAGSAGVPQGSVNGRLDRVFSKAETTFLVVCAGRLHPQKGHLDLLKAIEELVHHRGRTLHLVIFGKGETEVELRDFVHTHHLEKYVTLAGFVTDPRHWYVKADLFVLPSLFEGMPNALIEAVACGVPALSTTCPSGPREILDDGRCGGLVSPGDWSSMADAIEDAMEHPDDWKAKAKVARERVEQMFDPVTGIRRLEELMETVARR